MNEESIKTNHFNIFFFVIILIFSPLGLFFYTADESFN
jgi:hypothetical protein